MTSNQGTAKTYSLFIIAILVASALVATVGLLYFQGVSASPVKFKDMSGRDVQLNSTAKRIIVLESYWTEISCILGAKNKIVGIGTYVKDSVFIPSDVKNMTVVGDIFKGINLETVVSLKPDVVIMDYGYGKASDIIAGLEGLGIPVVTLYAQNYTDITNATLMIGKVIGAESKAQEVIAYMNSKYNPILTASAAIANSSRPTVMICNLDVWKNGEIYCYANSMWGRSVVDVGGINVALRDNPGLSYVKVNMEKVLLWNPDIIIIIGRTTSSLANQMNSMNSSLWPMLDAVKGGKVYTVLSGAKDPNAFLDWTPRIVVGEMQLAKYIQPSLYASLDWNSTAAALFSQYYNAMLGR